jgi:hypothetical protein
MPYVHVVRHFGLKLSHVHGTLFFFTKTFKNALRGLSVKTKEDSFFKKNKLKRLNTK